VQPLVSVVIPFFNADTFLAETVQSLTWQTLQDFEVVVVDDGSTVHRARQALAAALMARPPYAANASGAPTLPFPVRFVCHPVNLGLPAARNRGAQASRGQLIAFLDPDDVLEPTALEKLVLLVAHMRSFPGATTSYRHGPCAKCGSRALYTVQGLTRGV
jgi:glycosyltransferase involved in cell wall biosynthesis